MNRAAARTVPLVASLALLVTACGGSGDATATQEAPTDVSTVGTAAAPAAQDAARVAGSHPSTSTARTDRAAKVDSPARSSRVSGAGVAKRAAPTITKEATRPAAKPTGAGSSGEQETNQKIYTVKNGATDVGISKTQIKVGSVNMHGMALANIITAPLVRGNIAAISAVNDRGGILGRRIHLSDCDDGPGEVSRAKGCIKKLVTQDKIFSLITGIDWATGSIHDDLKEHQLPYVGAWAYSQTEWQDPYMFPAHMSMIHEAMAGAHWAKNVVKPKTYGLVCLTSPEMQLACNEVRKILDSSGARLVKKADISISETSMSSQVLAMRAANPEHVIHYVINPATMIKFVVEAAQQGYYPPRGLSGNHLASELLGPLFGKWPLGRYWTNTTYRLWGAEFIATMTKYARGNRGQNHHIVQAGYTAVNLFAQAAKKVGPNLTRQRLMAELGNGTVWRSDASLDQRFSYAASERYGNNWSPDNGQGREFIYRLDGTNTASNPDGSPQGWVPDPDQFVIHTHR